MSRDPIGEKGGVNLYQHCLNNSFLYFDSDGLLFEKFSNFYNHYGNRVITIAGGVAQIIAGKAMLGLGGAATGLSAGTSSIVTIPAMIVGGTLIAQGIGNITSGLTPKKYNPFRDLVEWGAGMVGLDKSTTGTTIFYTLEIATGAISLGGGLGVASKGGCIRAFFSKTRSRITKRMRRNISNNNPYAKPEFFPFPTKELVNASFIWKTSQVALAGHDTFQLNLATRSFFDERIKNEDEMINDVLEAIRIQSLDLRSKKAVYFSEHERYSLIEKLAEEKLASSLTNPPSIEGIMGELELLSADQEHFGR